MMDEKIFEETELKAKVDAYHEKQIRDQAFHIFVNVNKCSKKVAAWHAFEGGSTIAQLRQMVEYHKKTAVQRILTSDGDGPEPTASQWERFLTNQN